MHKKIDFLRVLVFTNFIFYLCSVGWCGKLTLMSKSVRSVPHSLYMLTKLPQLFS